MDDARNVPVRMGTDLLQLADRDTAKLVVRGLDREPFIGSDGNPWTLTIAGPSHPAAFRARDEARERFGRIVAERPKPEDSDPVRTELWTMAVRVLGWTPVELDGENFPWSEANALKVLSLSQPLRNQLAELLSSADSFTKPPSKS